MGEAENKSTPKPLRSDGGNVRLVVEPGSYAITGTDRAAAIVGRERSFVFVPADAQQSRFEKLERLLIANVEQQAATTKEKPSRRKPRMWAQELIFAKLREEFHPHGKPPKKMSPTELCREFGLDPRSHWSSMKRVHKRLFKK